MANTTVSHAGLQPTAALSQGLPARPWGVWATLAWAGAATMLFSVFEIANWGWGFKLSIEFRVFWALFASCAVVTMLVLATRSTGVGVRDYLGLTHLRVRDIALGIAAAVILHFVSPSIDALIQQFIGSWPDDRFNQPLSAPVLALGMFATFILAPLAEELVFRGFMYRGLESRLGTVATVLITGVTFGLIHALYGYGWDHAASAAWFGLVLGLLRWLTGGITASFVCHAMGNAGAVFWALYLIGTWIH